MSLDLTAWSGPLAAFATTFGACWLLARLAPRLGWVDPGDGCRKPQRVPLPLVGGAAVALGLIAAWAVAAAAGRPLDPPWSAPLALGAGASGPAPVPWVAGGLLTAFAVGLVDDLAPRGLRPLAKLAGQALAGLTLAWPLLWGGAPALGLVWVAAALVAMNALNTWDNADGAASGLTLVALAPLLPWAAAALAAVLPFNVRRSDGRALVGRLPRAILGDAGSHLLGMLVVVTPAAWPALALPLLDLARVCAERVRAGQPPWVGDRRHLAHRIERLGGAPWSVLGLLMLVAGPSLLLGHASGAGFSPPLAALGVLATAGLLLPATLLTRAPAAARPPPRELGLETSG